MSGKNNKTPAKKQQALVFHFAVRWSIEFNPKTLSMITNWMRETGDKFVFQAESTINDEGKRNPHYQGYIHLKNKRRPKALAVASNPALHGIEIRAASTAGQEHLRAYCMKDESRVAGPWSDKPIYMGKDLWPESRFLPWQKDLLLALRAEPDDRTMYWVHDAVGNKGKTKFAKFLAFKEAAVLLGYAQSADVLNLVSKLPGRKIYVWNLTRAKPAQLSELDLYSAMESIKDGAFINTKYETRQVLMDPPHVVVFANHLPKTAQISADRWNIMQITGTDTLVNVRDALNTTFIASPQREREPVQPQDNLFDPFADDEEAMRHHEEELEFHCSETQPPTQEEDWQAQEFDQEIEESQIWDL